MKKIKIILFTAAVLASGLAQAGDNKTEAKSETKTTAKSGTTLYWFKQVGSSLVYQASNVTGDEQERTECDGPTSQPICERGYAKSQLFDENDPSQGLASGQAGSPAEIIYDRQEN